MPNFALTMTRGDSRSYQATVTRSGSPLNLAGASLWFTAKASVSDPDGSAVFQKSIGSGITVTNEAGGLARIDIDPVDTSSFASDRTLECDLQVKESDGRVTTLCKGTLTVLRDVTRAT